MVTLRKRSQRQQRRNERLGENNVVKAMKLIRSFLQWKIQEVKCTTADQIYAILILLTFFLLTNFFFQCLLAP